MVAISALNSQHVAGSSLELVVNALNRNLVSSCTQPLDTPFEMWLNLTAQRKQWKHPDLFGNTT